MSSQKKSSRLEGKRFNYYRHLHRHLCRDCYAGGDAWLYPHFYSADGGTVPFDWRHPLYAVCYKG